MKNLSAGPEEAIVAITGSGALVGNAVHLVSVSGAASLSLPLAPTNGTYVRLIRTDTTDATNTVTVTRSGSTDVIMGAISYVLKSNMAVEFIYNSGLWSVKAAGFSLSGVGAPASSNAVSTLMARDSAGRAQVVDPAVSADIATKNYVDAAHLNVTVQLVSVSTTAVVNTWYRTDASGGAVTITLPSAPINGAEVVVENVGTANNVSYIRGGTDTVEGSTSAGTLGLGEYVDLTYRSSTGTWYMRRHLWSATAGTGMRRDSAGRVQVADPAVAADVATKNYVDTLAPSHFIDGGTKTGAFTAVAGASYVVTLPASLGSTALTLPTTPPQGTCVAFNRTDPNVYTSFASVTPGGSDTLLGGGTFTLSTGSAVFIYQGTQWVTLATGMYGMGGLLGPASSVGFTPSLMSRDASGRSQVVDPSALQDIATKRYVDGTVRSVSVNTTAVNRDLILVNAVAGAITITVPNAVGERVIVKKTDASSNAVTVVGSSGTIDGDANAILTGQDTSAVFVGDGTNIQIEAVYASPGAPATRYFEDVLLSSTQSLPANLFTTLTTFTSSRLDSSFGSCFNLSTGVWTCPESGIYHFSANGALSTYVANTTILPIIKQVANATTQAIAASMIEGSAAGDAGLWGLHGETYLAAGATVHIQFLQRTGSAVTMTVSGDLGHFRIRKVRI